MAAKITEDERRQIRELPSQGLSSEEVSRRLGVPKMRVAAIKAHTTMGTYAGVSAAASGLDVGDLDDAADAQDLSSALSAICGTRCVGTSSN
jgi:hypothetical protein